MPTIAERLQILRGDKSRRSFADFLGIPPSTLKNYEQGDTSPPLETLELVCEKMFISRRWLLLGEGLMLPSDAASDTPQAIEQPAVPTKAAGPCPRCAELEKELEKKSQYIEEINKNFVEALQSSMLLTEKNGELRLENLKLTHQLDTARQMCREYAQAIKEVGARDPIFDEPQNIPSSDPLHIR